MSCTNPRLNERLIELAEPERELPGDLSEHIAVCSDCARELLELKESWKMLGAFQVAPPAADVLARAHAAGLGGLAVKQRFARLQIAAVAGIAAAGAMAAWVGIPSGAFSDWGAMTSIPLLLVAYLVGFVAATGNRAARAVFAASATAGLAIACATQPSGEATHLCLPLGLLMAAVPIAIAAQGSRSPLRAQSANALRIGAGSGLLGVAVFRLHCDFGGLTHAVVEHLPMVMLSGLFAYGLTRGKTKVTEG